MVTYQRCNISVQNETNYTVPSIPAPTCQVTNTTVPSGGVPVINNTQTVMNCSYYKVCRQRPKCMQDD